MCYITNEHAWNETNVMIVEINEKVASEEKMREKEVGEKVEEKGVESRERKVRKQKRGGGRRKESQIPPTFPVYSV